MSISGAKAGYEQAYSDQGLRSSASAELGDAVKANEPQGEPVAMIRSRDWREGPDAGVWECTPGQWKRAVKNAEFAHFVKRHCEFHHEDGTVLEIEVGDAVYFPAHTRGTWNVIETVRKTYSCCRWTEQWL